MAKKSQSRLARDEEMRERAGLAKGRRFNREKSSRSWYELKITHQRSQAYIDKTARLFGQYAIPRVLIQIERNGEKDKWTELQSKVPVIMAATGAQFTAMWDSHKDIKRLCRTTEDLTAAYQIFEKYQAFDSEFYTTIGGIIEDLNAIFNRALKICLEKDDQARLASADPEGFAEGKVHAPVLAEAPDSNLLPAFRELAEVQEAEAASATAEDTLDSNVQSNQPTES